MQTLLFLTVIMIGFGVFIFLYIKFIADKSTKNQQVSYSKTEVPTSEQTSNQKMVDLMFAYDRGISDNIYINIFTQILKLPENYIQKILMVAKDSNDLFYPLGTTTEELAEKLIPQAENYASQYGAKITIVKGKYQMSDEKGDPINISLPIIKK